MALGAALRPRPQQLRGRPRPVRLGFMPASALRFSLNIGKLDGRLAYGRRLMRRAHGHFIAGLVLSLIGCTCWIATETLCDTVPFFQVFPSQLP